MTALGEAGGNMIEIKVLGPLRIRRDGADVTIRRAGERRLLALLLARRGEAVTTDSLIDELWPDRPSTQMRPTLHVQVSRLRGILGSRLTTHAQSYALSPAPGELDANLVDDLLAKAAEARSRNGSTEVRRLLRSALRQWAGSAYEGYRDLPTVALEADRMDQVRLEAHEEALQLDLDADDDAGIIGELDALVAAHPYRERLRALQMITLYRRGRRAEALHAYRRAYDLLVDEVGVEPGPELQRLHRAILTDDAGLGLTKQAAAHRSVNLLPPAVNGFVGRDDQLAQLDEIAGSGREGASVAVLSAVDGAAGGGKTALAVHWGHRARDRFPDGLLYVNLRGYGSAEPLSTVSALSLLLRGLGVPDAEIPADETAAVGLYRSRTSEGRVLVVLDNAVGACQIRPLLPSGPQCMALVTSRERLAGLIAINGARPVTLGMLAPDDATALLASIVGREHVARETAAVATLVELCGGLPLALRISGAALLAQADGVDIAAYAEALRHGDTLSLLALPGDPDSSVRTALSYSYVRLPERVRRLLRLLSLVPGDDVTAPAAAALVAEPAEETRTDLLDLCRVHLLEEHATGRFRFHDLIREYARALHRVEDPADAGARAWRRLLDWYGAQAHEADTRLRSTGRTPWVDASIDVHRFTGTDDAMAWFEAEGDNLLAAVVAATRSERERSWQLLESARNWLARRRPSLEWLPSVELALQAAKDAGSATGEARMSLGLAIALVYAGRKHEALGHFERNLELCRQGPDHHALITALFNLGGVLTELDRPHDAISVLMQARTLADRHGAADDTRIIVLQNLGYACTRAGDLAQAELHLREAVDMAAERDQPEYGAPAANNLAFLLAGQGRFEEAGPLLEAGLRAACTTGHRIAERRIRINLAHLAVRRGRLEQAEEQLRLAVQAYPQDDSESADLRARIEVLRSAGRPSAVRSGLG